MRFNTVDQNNKKDKFFITLNGKQDRSIVKESKFDYSAVFSTGVEKNYDLDFIYLDKTSYIKLGNFPEIPFFDLSQFTNKRFMFKASGMGAVEMTTGPNSTFAQVGESINDENENKLAEVLKNNKIYSIKKVLKSEKIGPASTYHYSLSLNKEGVLGLFNEMEEMSKEKLLGKGLPIAYPEDKINEFEKSLEKIEGEVIEIWIDKETYYPVKIQADFKNFEAKKNNEEIKTDISFSLELSKINEPVSIQAPEERESINELIQGVMGGFMGGVTMKNMEGTELIGGYFDMRDGLGFEVFENDYFADDDGDGLNNGDEMTHGTDKNNPDTDGDGYSDGDEVKSGYNPNGEGEILTFSKEPKSLTEDEHDNILSTSITGFETVAFRGPATNIGPVLLELGNFWEFKGGNPSVWLKINILPLPNFSLGDNFIKIEIDNVLNVNGENIYVPTESFKGDLFHTPALSESSYPVLSLSGLSTLKLKSNTIEDDIASVKGSVILKLLIGFKELEFTKDDVGKKKVSGDNEFTLESIKENKLKISYNVVDEDIFFVMAYDGSNKILNRTSYMNLNNIKLDNSYNDNVESVKVFVVLGVVEREYPFEIIK